MTYLPGSAKNFMTIGYLPTHLRDTGHAYGVGVNPERKADHGFNLRSVKGALADGYSDNQILTALNQAGAWNTSGFNTSGGALADWRKTVAADSYGLDAYQGTHGGIGRDTAQAAYDAGVNMDDLRASAAVHNRTWNPGAEEVYQQWFDDKQAGRRADMEEMAGSNKMSPIPGMDYSLTGQSAQGLKINRGSKFDDTRQGSRSVFGRRGKFTGTTQRTSPLNIGYSPNINAGGIN